MMELFKRKYKMVATDDKFLKLDPMEKCFTKYSYPKLQSHLTVNCAEMLIERSLTRCVFTYRWESKMSSTTWHSFNIGHFGKGKKIIF